MIFPKKLFKSYKENLIDEIKSVKEKDINKLFNLIKKIKNKNKKILIFGNGAGQSIANHFAVDISKNAKIKCLPFTDANHLTCFANDYGFENWVSKTIEIFKEKGDLVILISASGRSKNMINAANYCSKNKINFFTLTGFGNKTPLCKKSKNNIFVESKSFNIIEILHLYCLIQLVDLFKGKLVYSNKV